MKPNFIISEKQHNQLDSDGFLMLRNAISNQLVERLREADEKHRSILLEDESHPHASRACILDLGQRRDIIRYNHMELSDPELMIDLLSSPALMACSRLCGKESVPTTVDMIIKSKDSNLVRWHQGPTHSLKYPFFKVGIYLDEAPADEDCLRYVPGTHKDLQDIAELEQQYGWDPPGLVLQPAHPGDILIQHMMILHSSKIRYRPGLRRTIYPQFRSMEGIAESGFYPSEWAQTKRDWMDLIVERADPCDRPPGRISKTKDNLLTVTKRMAQQVSGRERASYSKIPTQTETYP
jgi:hypothetical protein